MSKSESRITPITREEWTDEVRDLFTVMDGPEAWEKGPSRTIIHHLGRHPTLSKRFLEFGRQLLVDSNLSDRVREVVTLYVAWTTYSDYEWASHLAFGLRVGLTDDDIEAVKQGPDSPHWTASERNLLRAVDQMRDSYDIDDELWSSLAEEFNEVQLVELVFTIGNYMQFSAVLNSLRIPLESWDHEVLAKYGSTKR